MKWLIFRLLGKENEVMIDNNISFFSLINI
jgi:hypothetical protein